MKVLSHLKGFASSFLFLLQAATANSSKPAESLTSADMTCSAQSQIKDGGNEVCASFKIAFLGDIFVM